MSAQVPAGSAETIRVGFLQRDGRYRIETLDLEDYVARVLAAEAARNSPAPALQALAITVRTYAMANAGRHRGDGFDMCDQTHCQVVGDATDDTRAAAQATAGLVLTFGGRPADVYYSASCGGHTERPSAVWPGAEDPPYLPVQIDEACQGEPEWTVRVDEDDLLRALRAAGFRGNRLAGLLVVAHDDSGRVSELVTSGLQPSRISGQRLREAVSAALGPQYIRSTAFEVRRVTGGYEFSGNGSGHGVGLCVIGSVNRAAAGESAAEILARYFPGTTIEAIGGAAPASTPRTTTAPAAPSPSPGLRVSLPADEEGARDRVTAMAASARVDIAAKLGVPPPAEISLRFDPTTDSFERATGQPWYVLSAVVAGEVHLAPIDLLETRGILERTVRHAMTHVLADPALERRPAWVREGLAVYFADPVAPPPADGGGPCPSDLDLVRPVSPGALATAYQAAEACVARQLTSGRDWRDIR